MKNGMPLQYPESPIELMAILKVATRSSFSVVSGTVGWMPGEDPTPDYTVFRRMQKIRMPNIQHLEMHPGESFLRISLLFDQVRMAFAKKMPTSSGDKVADIYPFEVLPHCHS